MILEFLKFSEAPVREVLRPRRGQLSSGFRRGGGREKVRGVWRGRFIWGSKVFGSRDFEMGLGFRSFVVLQL